MSLYESLYHRSCSYPFFFFSIKSNKITNVFKDKLMESGVSRTQTVTQVESDGSGGCALFVLSRTTAQIVDSVSSALQAKPLPSLQVPLTILCYK